MKSPNLVIAALLPIISAANISYAESNTMESAGIQKHEYTATSSCTQNNRNKTEECHSEKGYYETGIRFTNENGVCYEETAMLTSISTIETSAGQISAPALNTKRHSVPCNGGKNMIITYGIMNGNDQLVSSGEMNAMNGFPISISHMNQQTYVQKIGSQSTTAGKTDILIPGILETGVNVIITPEIQSDNRIKIDVSATITDLEGSNLSSPKPHTVNNTQTLVLDKGKIGALNVGNYTVEISVRSI